MKLLWYIFIACTLYQIVYQLVLIITIYVFKLSYKKKINVVKSVSVVICAKNETENLQKNLPFIFQQNYTDFEVILVDDGSDERITINDQRLKLITLTKEEKIGAGKKYALQKGIEHASKEVILLTDADCRPSSENWISEMASKINEKHKIVLGISPYEYANTFLNSLIEYETAQAALQYIGFALLGKPYMSVGRNVCYDAALLKTKKWSSKELSIASGDDDLAIQTLASIENTTVCLSKDSYMYSEPKTKWIDWFQQKSRHAESGFLYKFSDQLLLGSYLFAKAISYLSFLGLICLANEINLIALLSVIVAISFTCIVNMLLHRTLHISTRWNYSIILDPIYGFIQLLIGFRNLFQPKQKWR